MDIVIVKEALIMLIFFKLDQIIDISKKINLNRGSIALHYIGNGQKIY